MLSCRITSFSVYAHLLLTVTLEAVSSKSESYFFLKRDGQGQVLYLHLTKK